MDPQLILFIEPLGFCDCGKQTEFAEVVFRNRISSFTGLRKEGVAHTIIWLTYAHVWCVHVNSGIKIKAHFVTRAVNNG